MRRLSLLAFICTFVIGTSRVNSAEFIQPEGSSVTSEDGTLELEWSQEKGDTNTFTIERGANPSFEQSLLVYQGPDTATFVSGLPEGRHYFRLREGAGPWSDSVLIVEVEFVSGTFVVILLSAGTLCLIFLVTALVQGQRGLKSVRQMSQVGHSRSETETARL
jgi:PDZ domain-containing secreted protein